MSMAITFVNGAREFVYWPVLTGLTGTESLEVSVDGVIWAPMSWSGGELRALLATPAATSNPPEALVLPHGVASIRARYVANPEIVLRDIASSTVY
jgi:hypothetical protein